MLSTLSSLLCLFHFTSFFSLDLTLLKETSLGLNGLSHLLYQSLAPTQLLPLLHLTEGLVNHTGYALIRPCYQSQSLTLVLCSELPHLLLIFLRELTHHFLNRHNFLFGSTLFDLALIQILLYLHLLSSCPIVHIKGFLVEHEKGG